MRLATNGSVLTRRRDGPAGPGILPVIWPGIIQLGGRPIPSRRVTWSAYALLAVNGFLAYGIGYVTPFLRDDLGVPESVAALPASAAALGFLLGGFIGIALGARVGGRAAARASAVLIGVAVAVLAVSPAIEVMLVAAVAFGIGEAGINVFVNALLGVGEGSGATLISRANAAAMAGALVAPLALSVAANAPGVGWRAGLLIPVLPAFLLALVVPQPGRTRGSPHAGRPLPAAFWLVWLLVVAGVAVEFGFVVWGSTLVVARTGETVANATGLATLFVVGVFAGRVAGGVGTGSGRRTKQAIRVGLVGALLGGTVLWLAPSVPLAGIGLLLGGLGVSVLYPFGVATAIATVPGREVEASSRLALASGLAMAASPLVLGALTQAVGVTIGWLLVLALGAIGLGLVAFIEPAAAATAEARP